MCSDRSVTSGPISRPPGASSDEAGDEFGRFAVVAGGTVSVDAGLMPPRDGAGTSTQEANAATATDEQASRQHAGAAGEVGGQPGRAWTPTSVHVREAAGESGDQRRPADGRRRTPRGRPEACEGSRPPWVQIRPLPPITSANAGRSATGSPGVRRLVSVVFEHGAYVTPAPVRLRAPCAARRWPGRTATATHPAPQRRGQAVPRTAAGRRETQLLR